MQRAEEILSFWFGRIEKTVLPSEHRTRVWFGHDKEIDTQIREQFAQDFEKTVRGDYDDCEDDPRGTLALIIILDQISRHIYPDHAQAYEHDQKALDLCLRGIEREFDHELSLIERAFYYFPLMHSESLEMQALSVRAYQMLVSLAFPETRPMYEKFLEHTIDKYETVKEYGRFPYRNTVLGRKSTKAELTFLEKFNLHNGQQ